MQAKVSRPLSRFNDAIADHRERSVEIYAWNKAVELSVNA